MIIRGFNSTFANKIAEQLWSKVSALLFDQQFSEIMEEELGGRSTRAICPLDFEFELTDFT